MISENPTAELGGSLLLILPVLSNKVIFNAVTRCRRLKKEDRKPQL